MTELPIVLEHDPGAIRVWMAARMVQFSYGVDQIYWFSWTQIALKVTAMLGRAVLETICL